MQINHYSTAPAEACLVNKQLNKQANKPSYSQSSRSPSKHFDDRLDELLDIAQQLIQKKGVFHLAIHFSSSQLVCWTFDNPYNFQIYHAEEIFTEGFMQLFSSLESQLHTRIDRKQVSTILQSLKQLRQGKEGSELRNASIHMVNGYISLSFACDDTRYISHSDFIGSLSVDGG